MAVSEEIAEKVPNLKVAKWIFQLSNGMTHEDDQPIQQQLHTTLTTNDMSGFYKDACSALNWPVDDVILSKMTENNRQFIAQVDNEIEYATDNLGDVELKQLNYKKAKYYASIGDRESSLNLLDTLIEKTNTIGQNLQYHFLKVRISLFYLDEQMMQKTIDKALKFVEEAGDWEQRNRLKIYRGLYLMTVRDFKGAAESFQDGVATYTATELMEFKEFVFYTILCYVLALDRAKMKKNVILSSDIQEALHGLPLARSFFYSFYQCNYKEFFQSLAQVEQFMKNDRYMKPHYSHYVSQVKLKAYKQLLESYSSLSVRYMADLFGVSADYIDSELSMYVGCGKLQCTINKVDGTVETTSKDDRSRHYQNIIQLGDKLLNRMQKLSRVINL